MRIAMTFPFFTVENHDSTMNLMYSARPEPLTPVLREGGFEVRGMSTRVHRILSMTGRSQQAMTAFDVLMPEGWTTVEAYDGYGNLDKEGKHLLDERGRYRGKLHLDLDDVPCSGWFACRYALLDGPDQQHFPKREDLSDAVDRQWLAVADRIDVDRKKPGTFPTLVHNAYRWEKAPERKPLSEVLAKMDMGDYMEREIARVEAGKAPDWHPVLQWLNANYPKWQSPWAYWD